MSTSAAPLVLPPSEYWYRTSTVFLVEASSDIESRDGDDGPWSSFGIQVGTPPQNVRLFPGTSATTGTTVWVVRPEGCTANECGNNRGFLFHPNESSTWSTEGLSNNGLYDLTAFEENLLGYGGNAYYGFDNVTLGWQTDGLPELSHQVIAGYATKDFYLGSLGISPQPELFTTFNDPQPSILATLRNKSFIPSTSWAYTAGAYYQEPKIYGSLVLGGYDATRFLPSPENLTFTFGADVSRDLLVGIQEITSDSFKDPLLSSTIYAFIDSLVPHLWMPLNVCTAFEQAFNLTWNSTVELYLLTEDEHTRLVSLNPNVTLRLGSDALGSGFVSIVMPYGAFDLLASSPIVASPTYYFPLKRAQNDTQYTLGRTFLQQAYVIADYDRKTFSVSQALFPSTDVKPHIVSIQHPHAAANSPKDYDLQKGDLAAIVCSIVAFFVIVFVILNCVRRYRGRQVSTLSPLPSSLNYPEAKAFEKPELDHENTQIAQLDNVPIPELDITERFELCAEESHKIRENNQNRRFENPPNLRIEDMLAGRRELADSVLVGTEVPAEPV